MMYYRYSEYLKERFHEKVYKLPIKLDLTCPNRDGTCGKGGCIFCGEEGGSFENKEGSIEEQLQQAKKIIQKKYHAEKFIAYFQNFTNTYMPIQQFQDVIGQCLIDDIVGISISTRPDCLYAEHLDYLQTLCKKYMITMELGLQTVNYRTLKKINRGHGLWEFIDGVIRCHQKGLRVCAHIIIGLPWDDDDDLLECAGILNALKVDEVKIHALYIVKHTPLGEMYERGEIKMMSLLEYEQKVITFLQHLDPHIVVERLIGRAPKENSLFCNWNTSWWKIRDEIEATMKEKHYYQGQGIKKGMNYHD